MTNPTQERAKAATLAALLTPVAVGLVYVGVSCERYSPGPGRCESQWVTALAIGGMGGAWSAGFWQPNHALRQREREQLQELLPVPAGGGPEPERQAPSVPADPEEEQVLPDPIGLPEVYTGPELVRMTIEDLRSAARLVGLLELARQGKRAELVAALDGVQRVEG